MLITYNQNLVPFARKLRTTMTKQEVILWRKISRKQICAVQFFRQKPIGPYIVDFCAKTPKTVIELDGGHHFEDERQVKDEKRDSFLRAQGFIVLRFDNRSIVENWAGVGKIIRETIIRNSEKG